MKKGKANRHSRQAGRIFRRKQLGASAEEHQVLQAAAQVAVDTHATAAETALRRGDCVKAAHNVSAASYWHGRFVANGRDDVEVAGRLDNVERGFMKACVLGQRGASSAPPPQEAPKRQRRERQTRQLPLAPDAPEGTSRMGPGVFMRRK